jgi:hypothetical protein
MTVLPLGNRVLNELLPHRGIQISDTRGNGPHWPHVVLETGPAGLGKTSLATATACDWASRFPNKYNIVYASPHWPAVSFRGMVQDMVKASLTADPTYFESLAPLAKAFDQPQASNENRGTRSPGEFITENLYYYLEPLRAPVMAGDSLGPADSRFLAPLLRAADTAIRNKRRIVLFIDSLSPVGKDQVERVIETLRHPDDLLGNDVLPVWQRLSVLWLIYDGDPSLVSQLEHLSHTVIRFHLPESSRYWSPSVEIVKASQAKIHGRHQVKLRVKHESDVQPSKTLEGEHKAIRLSEYGWQGSGWLEVWHSMAYTLWKGLASDSTPTEFRPTAFPEIDEQLCGGLRPGTITAVIGSPGAGKRPLAFGMVAPWCLGGELAQSEYSLAVLFRDTRSDLLMQFPGLNLDRLSVLRIHPGDIRPDEFVGLIYEAIEKLDAVRKQEGGRVTRVLIDDISLIPTLYPLCHKDDSFFTALLQCCVQNHRSAIVLGTAVSTSARTIDALRMRAHYVIENTVQSTSESGADDRSVTVNLVSAPGVSTARPVLHLTVTNDGVPTVSTRPLDLDPSKQPCREQAETT